MSIRQYTLCLLGLLTLHVAAVPAYRGGITRTLKNGEQVTLYQHGDEHHHWFTNDKGERVVLEDGILRTDTLTANRVSKPARTPIDLNIAPRGLVILVNFKDKAFTTDKAEIENMLNGTDYSRDYSYINKTNGKNVTISAKGSARQYFIDQSLGQYQPTFDVVGPYTLSYNTSYYGKNSNRQDQNPYQMVIEAAQLANKDGIDFTQYDHNDDGEVDFFYVIYAGYGEADGGPAETIWPHTSNVSWFNVKVDGKLLGSYACGNEIEYASDLHTGIGTFCHEFCHVLGLPDLYDTGSSATHTLGSWDILDYGPYNNGGNTPPALSAYERFFLGWYTPVQLFGSGKVELTTNTQGNCAALICELTTSGNEQTHNMEGNDPKPLRFYLLENRQQVHWDKYIPGHGLIITKIIYNYKNWSNNTVNTSSSMGVDILEAKNTGAYFNGIGYATDAFPAGAKEYLGINGYEITEIEETNGAISFTLNGGTEPIIIEDIRTTNEQAQDIVGVYDIMGRPTTLSAQGLKLIVYKNGAVKAQY